MRSDRLITLKNKLRASGFLRGLQWALLFAAVAVPAQPSVDDAVVAQREHMPNATAPAENVEYVWSKPAGNGAGHHVPVPDRTPIIDRFLERHIGVQQQRAE